MQTKDTPYVYMFEAQYEKLDSDDSMPSEFGIYSILDVGATHIYTIYVVYGAWCMVVVSQKPLQPKTEDN